MAHQALLNPGILIRIAASRFLRQTCAFGVQAKDWQLGPDRFGERFLHRRYVGAKSLADLLELLTNGGIFCELLFTPFDEQRFQLFFPMPGILQTLSQMLQKW